MRVLVFLGPCTASNILQLLVTQEHISAEMGAFMTGISSKVQALYLLVLASSHLARGRNNILLFGWVPEKLEVCIHHVLKSHRQLHSLHRKCCSQ